MIPNIEPRQLVLFFSLAYGLAWLFFVPLGLSKAGLGWMPFNLSLPLMTVPGTLAPSLAALLTLRVTSHRWPGRRRIRYPLRFGLTLLLCPVLIGTTFAVLPALCLAKVAATLHWRCKVAAK